MNGIRTTNIKDSNEPGNGVLYISNHQREGKWLITTEDVKVKGYSVFNAFSKSGACPAVLATALNSIKMPELDYEEFVSITLATQPEI